MIRDYGDHALLLEFDSTDEVLAWSAAIRDAELLGVLDIVPASRTVLMKLADARVSGAHPAAAGQAETSQRYRIPRAADDVDVQIDVVYDGPDLDEVARLTELTADAGRRGAHRDTVAGRIRRFRTGVRVSGRR